MIGRGNLVAFDAHLSVEIVESIRCRYIPMRRSNLGDDLSEFLDRYGFDGLHTRHPLLRSLGHGLQDSRHYGSSAAVEDSKPVARTRKVLPR